jgi:hypothetical protein
MSDPMADDGAFWCYMNPKEAAEKIARLRKALSQIAWMDEFLSADAARDMMNIARDALAGVVGHKDIAS